MASSKRNSTESLEKQARQLYPHGHPRFNQILCQQMKLHSEKNHDYARGGDSLGNFKRVATILALYPQLSLSKPEVVALVYCLKQLDAVAYMLSENYEGNVEGIGTRLNDVSVYATLMRVIHEESTL